MNTKRTKILLVLLFAAGLLLLSGCTANFITDLRSDGSGLFSQEYSMTEEEITSYGLTLGEDLCTSQMEMDLSDMPPGTTVRQETSGDEIKCIFESPFASLDELRTIYVDYMNSTVNDLRIADDKFYYDVNLNMGESNDIGFIMYWTVKMPGTVSEHNATEKDGNTLTWSLPYEGDFNARAVSSMGGVGDWVWWVAGIGGLCLCLVVVIAIVVVVILLVRKNKQKSAAPVETPPPAA